MMKINVGVCWWILFYCSCYITYGVNCLRNVRVIIPEAVSRGENANLACMYDLEGDPLYVVKWYKNREEFYRYVPKEVPPVKVFPLPGVEVDTWVSDANQVVLRNSQPELSGRYRCEVSAETSFETEIVSGQMTIVEFPEKKPEIRVERTKYEVGERVRANCTFSGANPPANITWFLHETVVPRQYVNKYPPQLGTDNRYISRASLELDTDSSSFRVGKLVLKCVASVFNQFQNFATTGLDEEKPRSESVLGARDSATLSNAGDARATFSSVTLSVLLAQLSKQMLYQR